MTRIQITILGGLSLIFLGVSAGLMFLVLGETSSLAVMTMPDPESAFLSARIMEDIDANSNPVFRPVVFTGTVVARDTQTVLPNITVATPYTITHTDQQGNFVFHKVSTGTEITILPPFEFRPSAFTFSGQLTKTIFLEPNQLDLNILDKYSGVPVAQAQIQVHHIITETNNNGQASLIRVPVSGQIQIEHPRYQPLNLNYAMARSLTVTLIPNMIQGYLRDAITRQPLTGTSISLNGSLLKPGPNYALSLTQSLTYPLSLILKQPGYKLGQINFAPYAARTNFQLRQVKTAPCLTPPEIGQFCLDILLEPFEAKAIYIPFNLLSNPERIYAHFDFLERTELNAIVIDVKGDRGLLAWDSQVPYANDLTIDGNRPGWMSLKTLIAEAHQRDIYVIARMVVFKDDPLAFGYPTLASTYADGTVWRDGEGLGWTNPFREEVWQYNIDLAREVAELGVDEINLDYIRFPSDGNIGAIAYLQENTAETRTTAIRTFISQMRRSLAPYPVFLSADVFGLTVWVEPDNGMNIGQRVIDIAPHVDYLSPMIYPSTFIPGNLGLANPSADPYTVIYQSQEAAMARVSSPTLVRPWLQAYWYNLAEMQLQKQAANLAGSAGWMWWNASGVYDEVLFEASLSE